MNKIFYFSFLILLTSSFGYANPSFVGLIRLVSQPSSTVTFFGESAQFFSTVEGGTFCSTGGVFENCCYWPPSRMPPTEVNAGTITIKNSNSGEKISLPWNSSAGKYDGPNTGISWQPGNDLVITTTGEAIPSFEAHVTAPAPINLSTIQDPISVSADWKLIWLPANATNVDVGISGTKGTVLCRGQDKDGQISIPKKLIEMLGSVGEDVVIGATRENITTVNLDHAKVDIQSETGSGLMGKLGR